MQFTKGQKIFIVMAVFVGCLLFYANGVAFNLVSAPMFVNDIIAYAALTVAVTLTVITLTIVIRDKRKGVFFKTQKSYVDSMVQVGQASDTVSSPAIGQESTKKVDSFAEVLRQFSVQKTTSKLEADTIEQEKQLPKKSVIPPTKVMCPACRKEFSLPIYEIDYIVDFGRPKRSILIKRCPHCSTSIPLKRSGVVEEEDIWKE